MAMLQKPQIVTLGLAFAAFALTSAAPVSTLSARRTGCGRPACTRDRRWRGLHGLTGNSNRGRTRGFLLRTHRLHLDLSGLAGHLNGPFERLPGQTQLTGLTGRGVIQIGKIGTNFGLGVIRQSAFQSQGLGCGRLKTRAKPPHAAQDQQYQGHQLSRPPARQRALQEG